MTDEVTFGLDQGFGANLAVGLTATYRNVYDIPEARILVVDDATGQTRVATRDDWVQGGTVSGTLPNGQTVDQAVLRSAGRPDADRRHLLHQRRPQAAVPGGDPQPHQAARRPLELPGARHLQRLEVEDR